MEIFRIIVLALSGLLLTMVGMARTSNPIKAYLKNSGIQLPNDVDLLNEIRGVGSVMLFGGILTLLGTFVAPLKFSSSLIACLILIGFSAGRFISKGIDGKPNKLISQGIAFEVVLGTLNLVCVVYQVLN